MALPDILQWISTGRKTGTLHIERRSIHKKIFFKEGHISSSWSNDPRESLGQFLMRDRYVTEEQLFKALLRQEKEGRLIGSILVADGLVTEEALKVTLTTKAEETVYELFHWEEGKFEFKDGDYPKDILIQIDMGVTSVLLEGIRRVDEWQRIREVFPSEATTFTVKTGAHAVEAAVERQLLGLAAAGKTLEQIALETHRSPFETASVLFDLHTRALVAVAAAGPAARDEDPVGTIRGLLKLGALRLDEGRFDAALRAYEDVLAMDRLNQDAKKGLIAVMEARSRERALRSIPLAKVPVLTMDLAALTREKFEPQEGFVLSRVNGEWDVQSILKLCPMGEQEALKIFARLLERKVIELR